MGFIVNEPYHKRWHLGPHYIYDTRIFGDTVTMTVIQVSTGRTVERKVVKLNDPKWEKKSISFQLEMKEIYS